MFIPGKIALISHAGWNAVISPTGQQMFMKPLEANQQIKEIIDFQGFSYGIYLVRIITTDGIITSKFIKN